VVSEEDSRSIIGEKGAIGPGFMDLPWSGALKAKIVWRDPKKCYNFKLATGNAGTASCISTRTATLLLVVDSYSQVLSAAVHEYAQLIRNLNPPLRP